MSIKTKAIPSSTLLWSVCFTLQGVVLVFESVGDLCDLCDLCDQYDSELRKVIESHAPMKTRLVTLRPSAPWYGKEIVAEKRIRRQLERRWRKSGSEAAKQQYVNQSSRVRGIMNSAKMSYYASLINDNKSDFRVLFKSIDRLLHRKPEKHYPTCGSTKELCNKFAGFFSDKIVTIRRQLDALPRTDVPDFMILR